jgi:tetratricopeptide (TPR) repeat protein
MNERPPLDDTVDVPPSGDDLDAGLAAAFGPDSGPPLPAGGSVLKALSAGLPSVPRILLREPDSFGGSPIVRPSSEEMPEKQDAAARLQLHGEIARGGMGAVLKGRDVDVGRDVAVKVLLETHQGKTEMLQRFVEEAQISGQLQHPGITPVYELGQFADKRPYFTMKLVKGKTLATLLAARKSTDEERTRYIVIFTQICQTLAYAHARGVIHRDLKPSNVMVGAFGEVQVMDWGLAKVLKEGGIADELKRKEHVEVSVIRTQRSEGSSTPDAGSHTQLGTMLGTPAYMAPEQARGDVDLVDERADVFGLGAILCEILTGRPPYVGKGAELQYMARAAKLEDAFSRLEACGPEAELIALTKDCLAAELWERPRHAGEVADRVTAYQQSVAERLRQAELAETEARARAEEETKTRAEAEARLSAERRARRMTLGLAAAVLLALTLAGGGGLWYQQHVSAQRQEAARHQAELREAVAAALAKVADLRQRARWDEARAVLEQVRQRMGPSGADDLRDEVAQAEKDLALVDRLDAARLKASVWVEGHFDHAAAVREYAAAFRAAGIIEETEAAEVVAERIRVSAVREQLVAAVDDWALRVGDDGLALRKWLLTVARAADPDPWRDRIRDAKVWQDRTALERLAREAKVSELSPQVLYVVGNLLGDRGADAVPLLTAAQRRYPSDFWLNYALGTELKDSKRWEEAIGYYRAALALRPATVAVYNNLGIALGDKGRVEEAIAEFKRAVELDPKFAYAHNNLGIALRDKGRVDEAIAEYQKAIELDPKYAYAHNNLGNALRDKGRVDEAIADYQKAIELDPKYANAHYNLGIALRNKGRVDEAIAEYQKALQLNSKDVDAHNVLGAILCDVKHDYDGAIVCFNKALQLDPKDAKAHTNLGVALHGKGRLEEAIAEYQKAIELDPKLANAHNLLGAILCDIKHDYDGAIACFHIVLELNPKDAEAHTNLGVALSHKSRVDEAIAEYHKAIELDPKLANAHNVLGVALINKGRLEEAIAQWKMVLELDPKNASARSNLAHFEPTAALLSKWPDFLQGKFQPRDNIQRLHLAQLCIDKKYHCAAAQLYADAFDSEPKRADDLESGYRYNAACCAALTAAGQGEDVAKLDSKERSRWRKQALDWLRADLTAYGKLVDSSKPQDRTLVKQRFQHCQHDPDLVGIRDAKELAKLPTEERQACEKLWADVAALVKKSEAVK